MWSKCFIATLACATAVIYICIRSVARLSPELIANWTRVLSIFVFIKLIKLIPRCWHLLCKRRLVYQILHEFGMDRKGLNSPATTHNLNDNMNLPAVCTFYVGRWLSRAQAERTEEHTVAFKHGKSTKWSLFQKNKRTNKAIFVPELKYYRCNVSN